MGLTIFETDLSPTHLGKHRRWICHLPYLIWASL